jgi:hypothetical protein
VLFRSPTLRIALLFAAAPYSNWVMLITPLLDKNILENSQELRDVKTAEAT